MYRVLRTGAWVAVMCSSLLIHSQTISVQEINPTHSDTGGNAATGGRVNHVARATDNIYYAASEYGGLFKSTDAGLTWSRLDAHLPTRPIDVKADPADPDRVIATSLYDGRVTSLAGINVSTDGGANWAKPATATPPNNFCASTLGLSEPSAFAIAFDPENVSHVFAGTNCGLASSTDAGLSWTFLNPGPGTRATSVFGVVVHHGGIIDTCGLGGHRRSTDGGATWTGPQAGGAPLPAGYCSIAASPTESYVLFATSGISIFESDNGGGTWNTQFGNPVPQGRVPFVRTNKRQGQAFDLWFGDVTLYRASCTTPANPAPGGTARCPASSAWTEAQQGAHFDLGEVAFASPLDLAACRRGCTVHREVCLADCADLRQECLTEPHRPGVAVCSQLLAKCRTRCATQFNKCNVDCVNALDACPSVMCSDGGIYVNSLTRSPACQAPNWTQPEVTPRGLWLWSLGGGNIPNSLSNEDLYMGAQDNGSFATLNAGASPPSWTNPDCCDVFDTVSDATQVLVTECCFSPLPANRVFRRNAGITDGGEIPNYPPGSVPAFRFPDEIARFGTNRYGLITTSGIFATLDVTANPITWTALGTNAPTTACGLWAAGPFSNPTFYALTGSCSGNSGETLMGYVGTSSTGTWQNVTLPTGFTGVGIFAVDPNNANRLFVSGFNSTGVHMLRSSDGGTTWQQDSTLDGLMNGNGTYRMQTSSYAQPTLVAFDPNNSNNLLAGAADAGIFLSQDNGSSWTVVTNNSGVPSNPVIPRPHWAYFDHECSTYNIFIGTQGRGAWRLSYQDPAGITVGACQRKCDAAAPDCLLECARERNRCIAEFDRSKGLPELCEQRFLGCRERCSVARNVCRQHCVDCPQ
jgi:photosystem II stability/assembly factor-like uncharacterized protein